MANSDEKKRVREIISVFIKHGMKDGIKSVTDPYQIRLAFEELGPTFVKIGQILSTRADILPKEYILEFEKLQDDVKGEPYENVKVIIEENLGCPIDEVFRSFKRNPEASASMAVVHRGVLKDGEEVVIKVQRPGIRETMMRDISVLRKISRFAKIAPQSDVIDVRDIIEELSQAINRELDFNIEASNIDIFRENNKDIDCIDCPKVYDDYTTSKILVMEYVKGTKIDDIENLKEKGYDLEDISVKLANNYFKQIFKDGFFHADPHPGNILIRDGKIVYIDFGLVGNIDKGMRDKFLEFLYGVASRNVEVMMYSIMKIGIQKDTINTKKLYSDIESIYNTYIETNLSDIDLPQMMEQVFNACRKNNIAIPKNVTMMMKGLITIEGLVEKINPDLNIMNVAVPFVKQQMLEKKDIKHEFLEQLENVYLLSKSGVKIPVKLLELINTTLAGKLKVQLELEDNNLEQGFNDLNKMVNRMTFGLIIASIIVGSAIIVNSNAGPKIYGISAFGAIGYLGAGIMGIWLLYSILKSGKM
ncbi:ubiquinone biosynthesis protein [Clostridium amylolyticum]|uniref:Ubiquinone biosynthesis protein n=1 Tax=Clostridium amylolyticum TaxID=1121298 RepID=A0A1M6HGS0_9CLOT|nr:AarF/ABC1/UbiB kinase family protein [Clostridium amylolyticum]SHJ21393.1 ubiquinone biosynthesis protein [Clostridium amylolyticum]